MLTTPLTEPPATETPLDPETASRLQKIWKKAYAAKTQDDLIDLYALWSDSYDEDHEAIGYFGHRLTAELFARHCGDPEARILDAGAGTGAGGVELAKRGFTRLCALDFSAEMLEKARAKGVFEELCEADLGAPLDAFESDHFDGAILVGVFSYGQAPAHALEEIVRIVRPGGKIAFTMRQDFFDQDAMGVRSFIEELENAGAWRRVELSEPHPYLPKDGSRSGRPYPGAWPRRPPRRRRRHPGRHLAQVPHRRHLAALGRSGTQVADLVARPEAVLRLGRARSRGSGDRLRAREGAL